MSNVLARWGRQVYRVRWWLLGLSLLPLVPAIIVLEQGASLEAGTLLATTQSGPAADLMARQLPGQPVAFDLIFSSPTLRTTDRAFREEVARALQPIKADAKVARVRTAYDAEPPDPVYLSRDSRHVRAVVELKARSTGQASLEFSSVPPAVYASLRALVRSGTLDVVAALLALGVGMLAMVGGMAGTTLLARYMSVSAYAPNIVTIIGLGVAIDLSLFIVSRFREEIERHPAPEALAATCQTTGRAILFSGVTVAIGLLGMLGLGLGNVGSLGLSGTIVVALSVVYGLTFLPAVPAILGPRVHALSLPFIRPAQPGAGSGFWRRLARWSWRTRGAFFCWSRVSSACWGCRSFTSGSAPVT